MAKVNSLIVDLENTTDADLLQKMNSAVEIKPAENANTKLDLAISHAAAIDTTDLMEFLTTLLLRITTWGTLTLIYDEVRIPNTNAVQILHQLNDIAVSLHNKTPVKYTGELSITTPFQRSDYVKPFLHNFLESAAEQSPDAPCLSFYKALDPKVETESFTYRSMNARANDLSNMIREMADIRPDDIIPLIMPKSPELYVSTLATLKSGAAYCPIDPSTPTQRLAFILSELKPKLVLVSAEVTDWDEKEQPWLSLPTLTVRMSDLHESVNINSTIPNLMPRHLAYVLFTSGTTGVPKGVLITHEAVTHAINSLTAVVPTVPNGKLLQFAAPTFDVSVFDMFYSYHNVMTLISASQESLITDLQMIISHSGATHLSMTPTVTGRLNRDNVPSVKVLISMGESMTDRVVHHFSSNCCTLINACGPTEASIVQSSLQVLPTEHPDARGITNIGTPFPSAQLLVLDPASRTILPLGAKGELHIAGPQLARGYLNRPDLTAEKFFNISLPDGRETRVYATGDIVRLHHDRSLTHFGRSDDQIKLNGYRIELEEINSVTERHPSVKQCVSVVIDFPGSEGQTTKRLLSFIQLQGPLSDTAEIDFLPHEPHTETLHQIITHLKSHVPHYMIPSFLILLTRIPLNPAGKTDRRAIRTLLANLPTISIPSIMYLTTTTPSNISNHVWTEKSLAFRNVLAAVSGVSEETITGETNIFHLGLDSIGVMEVCGRLRREYGISLSVLTVLKVGSVAPICDVLDGNEKGLVEAETGEVETFEKFRVAVRDQLAGVVAADCLFIPATPLQEGLLVASSATADAYYGHIAFQLEPTTDIARLRTAWELVISHTEILRTHFHPVDHPTITYAQIINPPTTPIHWTPDTISITNTNDLHHHIRHQILPTLNVLTSPPLSFTTFTNTQTQRTTLLLTLHHALYDGWALHHIYADVQQAYNTLLPPTPRPQFSSLLPTILSQTSPQHLESQKDYWTNHLKDVEYTPFPDLTTTTIKPSPDTTHRTILTSRTPLSTLERLSSSLGLPLLTLTQTAFSLLLSHYLSTTTPTYGHVLSSRSMDAPFDPTQVVGPVLNTVVCALDVRGTAREVLDRCRREHVEMLEYQFAPLRKVVGWCGKEVGERLFDVLFVFQKALEDPSAREANSWYSHVDEWQEADASIALEVEPTPTGTLLLRLNYKTSTMTEAHARLLLEQYDSILNNLLTNPDLPTSHLRLPTNLLSIHTLIPLTPTTNTMHDLYTHTAHRTPNSAALAFCSHISPSGTATEKIWTYAELDTISNQFTHMLIEDGVEIEDRVVLMAPKSMMWFAALLGILKAGAVYVPIDHEAPEDRWGFIVEETQPKVIVTFRERVEQSASSFEGKLLALDDITFEKRLASYPSTPAPTRSLTPENVAYIIYTSGTTGRPKGVEVTHSNITHGITAQKSLLTWSPPSRALQFCSPSFDAHISEIFNPFALGLCITTATNDLLLTSLKTVVNAMKINHAVLTPSLLATLPRTEFSTMKSVVTGGEPLTPQIIRDWSPTNGIWNAYGPTECSVMVSFKKEVTSDTKPTDIGTVIPNASAYVMSADMIPVPKGVVGELCVGGKIVAKGYLNRPELTAEKFVMIEVDGITERVYKTGDLVRMMPDGSLDFIGREDDQVKINGIRLELDEVGNYLKDALSTMVTSVVAVLAPHPSFAKKQLIAFAVPKSVDGSNQAPCHILVDEVPSAVFEARTLLPRHMRPSHMMLINRVPLGATGKTDRKLLARLFADMSGDGLERFGRAGGELVEEGEWTELEMTVRDIVAKKQSIPPETIHKHSTLFSLGVDSLGAISLTAAFKQAGHIITVSELIQAGTTPAIADVLQSKSSTVAPDVIQQIEGFMTDFDINVRRVVAETVPSLEGQIEKAYPCLPLQEGMVIRTIHSEGSEYINQMLFTLRHEISADTLRNGWITQVSSTDILRTAFFVSPKLESAVQLLLRPDVLTFDHGYFFKSTNEEDQWEDHQRAARRHVFDSISRHQPPVSFMLLTENGTVSSICLTIHHALYDGWSLPLMLSDLSDASLGKPLPIRPRFSEFLKGLEAFRGQDAESFWRESMEGAVRSAFPILTGDVDKTTTKGASLSVSESITSQIPQSELEEGSRSLNATVNAVLQATWGKLLSQYIGSEDVIFGKVLSGRTIPLEGVEDIVGPCFNTLPCRVVIPTGATNRNLVEAVQQQDVKGMQYMHTPLRNIQNWIGQTSESLFDTLLLYQKTGAQDATDSIFEKGHSNFEMGADMAIVIEVLPIDGNITVRITTRTNLIPASHLNILLRQFDHTLSEVLRHPNESANDIRLVDNRLSSVLRNTSLTSHANFAGLVHEAFEAQVAKTPDKIALAWAKSLSEPPNTFTYDDINRSANQIARHIQQDIKASKIVPLCMDKSPLSYMALLAIQKLGCAYVPVDSELPAERQAFICRNVDAEVVLCSTSAAPTLLALNLEAKIVNLETNDVWTAEADTDLNISTSPTDLAYVIFTSGTTGTPKGVMVEHRSAMACLHHYRLSQPNLPEGRFTQFASFSFDISVAEIFSAWHNGDTICSASKDLLFRDLNATLNVLAVDLATLPATLAVLVKPQLVPTLKVLYTGGETMSRRMLDECVTLDDINLYNAYGPTEATVLCTLTPRLQRGSNPRNIGRPLGESSIYIMSPSMLPVVIGGVGELCVGGPQLARGYLKNADLTADKFRFVESAGERIYRTGDLARALPDGTIEFLGRMDCQVKVNGLRIELEEIEGIISRCSSVKNVAATVVKPKDQARQTIVAFVTLNEEDGVGDKVGETACRVQNSNFNLHARAEIRGEAQRQLPQYMVPTHVLVVNEMPLGRTDKIDRKQLAALYDAIDVRVLVDDEIEDSGTEANQEIELVIRKAIAEVVGLPLESVKGSASIYQLGIDSINAIRLSALLRDLGIKTSVSQIMKHTSASRLAKHISHTQSSKAKDPPSHPGPKIHEDVQAAIRQERINLFSDTDAILKIYPCTPLQEGMIAQTLENGGRTYFGFFTFELSASTDVERLLSAFKQVMQANDILRTTFHMTDDDAHLYLQAVHSEVCMNVYREEVRSDSGLPAAAKQYMDQEAASFILTRTPICFGLLKSPATTWFILGLHHALYDGWSFSLLMRDVHKVYSNDEVLKRPQFDIIMTHLSTVSEGQGREFWKQELDGYVPMSFPNLHGRVAGKLEADGRAAHVFELSSDVDLHLIQNLCRQFEISEQAIGEAAWALLLSAYCGERDVAFGHVVSGRMLPLQGIEDVMGPTFNTIPCRVVIDDSKPAIELVRTIHRFNIEAIPFHHSPVRDVGKSGDIPAELSLFDSIFLYQKIGHDSTFDAFWREVPTETELEYAVSIEMLPSATGFKWRGACKASKMPEEQLSILLKQVDMLFARIVSNPEGTSKSSNTLARNEITSDLHSVQRQAFGALNKLYKKRTRLNTAVGAIKAAITVGPGMRKSLDQAAMMHQYVEHYAQNAPNASAFEFAETIGDGKSPAVKLSYRELNNLANQFAHFLLKRGVKTDMAVPICMTRSPQMYIAILGILKAGAAYVPMDPELPEARKMFILEDVKADFLIVNDGATVPSVKALSVTCICIDQSAPQWRRMPKTNPNVKVPPESLAYIIFTSGTTGTPKGVMIEHRNVTSAMVSFRKLIPTRGAVRFLQFASYNFDVSVFEMFYTWSVGGAVVTAPKDALLEDLELSIRYFGVTHADLTPTISSLVRREAVPRLQILVSGGEALTQQATIGCTMFPDVTSDIHPRNIGKPFETCSAYILTTNLQVVPHGGVGELCIGGPQVARGYLNRPDLTNERFVDFAGDRVYRTGDYARMLSDGTIEFLGRQDDQVKMRGLRIELEEINAALRNADGSIKDAVTLILKHPQQARDQLVAFISTAEMRSRTQEAACIIVAKPGDPGIVQKALHSAQVSLPQYMVPGIIFHISHMPLGSTGKADRRALSQLFCSLDITEVQKLSTEEYDTNPQWSQVELRLRRCIASVAKVPEDTISRNTSVYHVGLDSVSAIRVRAILKQNDGITLSVAEIMRCGTIHRMASLIENASGGSDSQISSLEVEPALKARIFREHQLDPSNIVGVYPCTPLQEGMISESIRSGGNVYFNHITFVLPTDIDIPNLLGSWRAVIRANEILRTSFHAVNDVRTPLAYVQAVHRDVWMPVDYQTLDGEDEVDHAIELHISEARKEAHALTHPPIRFGLLTSPTKTSMVVTLHHALYDGWSLPLILADVQRAYFGHDLPRRLQFSSMLPYIAVQPAAADAGKFELVKCHMQLVTDSNCRLLANLLKELRAQSISFQFARHARRANSISLQCVGQVAFSLLVAAYIGEPDVALGHVVSGRSISLDGVEGIIGPSFNTIPVRLNISKAETNFGLLQTAHLSNIAALAHHQTPLRSIQKWLPELEGRPIFDCLFLFQTSSGGPSSERQFLIAETGKADVNYAVCFEMESGSQFETVLRVSCKASTMNEDQLRLFADQLDLVITDLLTNLNSTPSFQRSLARSSTASFIPQKPLSGSISMVTLLHEYVEQRAAAHTDDVALEFWRRIHDKTASQMEKLSYREFNDRANRLAHYLLKTGVAPKSFVAVCMDRSLWQYISLVAIMKAGAAYVPVEPSAPLERKQYIFKNVKAEVVLACPDSVTGLGELQGGAQVVVVGDDLLETLQAMPFSNPKVDMSGSDLAYAIYTSGTTGTPKGVLIEHHSAVEALKAFQDLLPWTSTSRFLQFASFAFDVSVFEMFFAWSTGITLVTAPKDELLLDLEAALNVLQVTHADLTPTVAALVRGSTPLQVLVTGGEALTQQVIDTWIDRCAIFNAYGPTEATIGCTMTQVSNNTRLVNIGKTFPTCSAYVIDGTDILPRGAVGELCIGGPHVARGYMNQPEMTAEKFIELPGGGERVYRTGDVVRMLASGEIIFEGRKDDQVKINGIRIELSEINAVIGEADSHIQEAVTLVLQHPELPRRQLVAFVSSGRKDHGKDRSTCTLISTEQTHSLLETAFRACESKLPPYMVPAHFFLIDQLPLGVTGKCNIKVLEKLFTSLDPGSLQNSKPDDIVSWSPTEEVICQVLAAVSGTAPTSIQRNTTIFQLGLDSINAITLAAHLKAKNLHIAISDIMRFPTVPGMASRCTNAITDVSTPNADELLKSFAAAIRPKLLRNGTIKEENVQDIYPCTPLQEGMIIETMKLKGSAYVNHSMVLLERSTNVNKLLDAWELVIQANDILRTSFHSTDDPVHSFAQVVHKDAWMPVVRESVRNEYITTEFGEYTTAFNTNLDWTRPPLGFAVFIGSEQTWMVVSLHHALYDGWSLGLMMQDVQYAYHSLSALQRPQYKAMVSNILSTSTEEAQHHWTETLVDPTPCKFPKQLMGENPSNELELAEAFSATHITELRIAEVESACRTLNVSAQAIGQAAWAILLSTYTGEETVTFGQVLSGRTSEDSQKVMGPTFNTIPCHAQIEQGGVNADLVRAIHNANVRNFSYQHTPLTSIIKWTGKNLKGCPLFDTLFLFQIGSAKIEDELEGRLWHPVNSKAEVNFSVALEMEPHSSDGKFHLVASSRATIMPEVHLKLLLAQFEMIITNLIRSPQSQILDLPSNPSLLSSHEQRRPPSLSIPLASHVETWAAETPDKIALHFTTSLAPSLETDITLTYAQLNYKANQLAHLLITHGVKPGIFVPICLHRSPNMYIAILAVLKAGGAYVPVDPEAPKSRQLFIFGDVGADLVLCDSATFQNLCAEVNFRAINLELVSEYMDAMSTQNTGVVRSAASIAYMIYTSGTTGTPKGVVINDLAASEAILSFQELIPAKSSSRFLQFASFTFDVSVFEIFFSWSIGTTLVTAPKTLLLANLSECINKLGVTHMDLTPTVSSMLRRSDVRTVEYIITGGETVTQTVIDQWGDGKSLINAYGPTEATIGCTMNRKVVSTTHRTNIGQPWPSCSAFVISPNRQILPRGAIGELCIGGPQVADGYHNRPDLTAEKFFTLGTYGRVYSTGDLVRMLGDGTILFLGRTDHQVKRNGLRIELDEISSTIAKAHPKITGAVTLVVKHPQQVRDQIVTFFTTSETTTTTITTAPAILPDSPSLQEMIDAAFQTARSTLPNYMLPALCLPISNLSRGSTNKVDTKILSHIFETQDLASLSCYSETSSSETVSNGELTPLAITIRSALADFGGIEEKEVGLRTSIFHLGLDSISSIRLSSKFRECGVHLSVPEILQNFTVDKMVQHITARDADSVVASVVPNAAGSELVSHISEFLGSDMIDDVIPRQLNQPSFNIAAIYSCVGGQVYTLDTWAASDGKEFVHCFAFASSPVLDTEKLYTAWKTLVETSDIFRTAFVSTSNPELPYLQVVLRDSPLSWTVDTHDKDFMEHIVQDCVIYERSQLTAVTSPPLRTRLLQFRNKSVLVLTIHHALYDGWSMEVAIANLQKLYNGESVNSSNPQWNAFLSNVWHQRQSPVTQSYWKKTIGNHIPPLFPKRIPSSTEQCKHFVPGAVPKASQITTFCRQHGFTLQALMLAAWAKLQARETQSTDAIFGLYQSGRSVAVEGVERMAAPALNMLPCLVRDAVDSGLIALAKKVQDYLVQSASHGQVYLRDVQRWSNNTHALIVNVFLNFLFFAGDSTPEEKRLFTPLKTHEWYMSTDPPSSRNLGIGKPTVTAAENHINLEIGVSNDMIDIGLFSQPGFITQMEGEAIVAELCRMIGGVVNVRLQQKEA
ncbi:hypothetical protein HDV00_006657 [Rhizophlyctis rosea]|nr:hypothetical protein HDV00_006657 [Rhizophlyctis rosea]